MARVEVPVTKIDVPLLFRLWNTPGIKINDVAAGLGVSLNVLRRLRDQYGLPEKPAERADEGDQQEDDPTPEEIAARAAEVRRSWPAWRISGATRPVALRYTYDGRQHVFREASH